MSFTGSYTEDEPKRCILPIRPEYSRSKTRRRFYTCKMHKSKFDKFYAISTFISHRNLKAGSKELNCCYYTRHIVLACIVPLQLKQTWKCDFYVFFTFQFSYPKNLFMKQNFYRIHYPVTKELLSLGMYIQESPYS